MTLPVHRVFSSKDLHYPEWKAVFARNVIKALEHNYQLFAALQTRSLCGNHSLPNHIDENIPPWNPFMCCVCQWPLWDDFSGCHCSRLIREEVERDKEIWRELRRKKAKNKLKSKHKIFCAVQKPHQAHVKWRQLRVVESLGLNATLQLLNCSFPAGAFLLFVMICDMWLCSIWFSSEVLCIFVWF